MSRWVEHQLQPRDQQSWLGVAAGEEEGGGWAGAAWLWLAHHLWACPSLNISLTDWDLQHPCCFSSIDPLPVPHALLQRSPLSEEFCFGPRCDAPERTVVPLRDASVSSECPSLLTSHHSPLAPITWTVFPVCCQQFPDPPWSRCQVCASPKRCVMRYGWLRDAGRASWLFLLKASWGVQREVCACKRGHRDAPLGSAWKANTGELFRTPESCYMPRCN